MGNLRIYDIIDVQNKGGNGSILLPLASLKGDGFYSDSRTYDISRCPQDGVRQSECLRNWASEEHPTDDARMNMYQRWNDPDTGKTNEFTGICPPRKVSVLRT